MGTHLDLLGRCPRQREIEQDQLEPLLARADANVVGLDVAVGDPFPFQRGDGLEQVLAEPQEQLQAQPTLLAEPLGQGLLARIVEHQDRPAPDLADVVQADDELAPQVPDRLGLVAEPGVVLGLSGDLEHELVPGPLHQDRHARRTSAQHSLDLKAPFHSVPPPGLGRIHGPLRTRVCQLVLDGVEQLEKIRRGGDAEVDVWIGAPADQFLKLRPRSVQDRGDLQPVVFAQCPRNLGRALAGRAPREDVVRDRTEREDIGRLGRRLRVEK